MAQLAEVQARTKAHLQAIEAQRKQEGAAREVHDEDVQKKMAALQEHVTSLQREREALKAEMAELQNQLTQKGE